MKSSKIINENFIIDNMDSKNQKLKNIKDSGFYLDRGLEVLLNSKKDKAACKSLYKIKPESDVLIIGLCLKDKMKLTYDITYNIKKSEVVFFRPKANFSLSYLNSNFLYYIFDLKSFVKAKAIFDITLIDDICKKGHLEIKKAPYIMKSCISEIAAIDKISPKSFLEYANVKGQFFNYLNCLLRLKENQQSTFCTGSCQNINCDKYIISEARKIIIDNLDNYLSVKEISLRLGLSTYRLQSMFKDHLGTTVYDYILNTKIDYSKTLLKKTDLNILDISIKTGYSNPSKFSTAFKKITGLTPTEYRNLD